MSTSIDELPPWRAVRVTRTVVVADLVESVRLMQTDELDVIDRWRRFVAEVIAELLPNYAGRLVKSLGDGMLLEFAAPLQAVGAAMELHERVARFNVGHPRQAQFWLRCAVHEAEVVVDGLDVYGAGVNLAARLATLARPGESVVSDTVRDVVALDLIAELDDLGACHLKHMSEPVRAWRLAGPGRRTKPDAEQPVPWLPTLLVLPFATSGDSPDDGLCAVLCDDLITTLAQNRRWRLLSGLSAHEICARAPSMAELNRHAGVNYVLSGRCVRIGERLRVCAELADASNQRVMWSFEHRCDAAEVFGGDVVMRHAMAAGLTEALTREELSRGKRLALANRESHWLLAQGLSVLRGILPQPAEAAS